MVTTANSGSKKLLRLFFSPAVALMSRLSVPRKFILLGLMSLIAIAVVVYSLYTSLDQVISFSQRELKGLDLVKPFPRAVQMLQQHRGLSVGILGGDATMRDRRARTEMEAVGAFEAMEMELPPSLTSGEDFRHIRTDWERLRKEGLDWTAAENFAAHNRLIERIQSFEGTVADEYALTLDPELSTFYLIDTIVNKLPHALEHLGLLRAYGTGILAGKQASAQQMVELNTLVAELDDALWLLGANLDKTGRHNPALQGLISAASKDITASAQQITGVVTSDILSGNFATRPNIFFGMSSAAIDDGYTQLHEALLPATEALIRARIARAENTLRFSVGIAALLFLVAAYFSIGICCAVIANIRSLARSAHAFAGGDLGMRINLDARDELGQVGQSFNEMAEGFGALLEVSRENEARLHELSVHLEERVEERTRELDAANKRLQEEIAERERAESALREKAAVFRQLTENVREVFWVGSPDWNEVIYISPAYEKIWGRSCESLYAKPWDWLDAVVEADREQVIGAINTKSAGNLSDAAFPEYRILRPDGSERWIYARAFPIHDEKGKVFRIAGIAEDITVRKWAEEEIHRLAFYDALTKLPNRRLFFDRFGAALTASVRLNNHGAVLFIDLDRFKQLNDTLGHDYGDQLLVEVAARIRSCVREMDTVARLGGDEFVVLIEDVSEDQEEAAHKVGLVAEKIREALAHPYHLNGHEHHSSPSIGVSLYRGNDESVVELLHHADMAMYQAKESGRNAVRFFDPVMQNNVATRAALINDLRNAIERKQLHLHYQLQVDSDNRPVGAEALLRWIHPQRGTVMPEQMLPIAEESALIIGIGDWVLDAACRQLALWGANEKMRDLVLTVNISAKQFAMPDFAGKVANAMRAHRINPARLKLELTESMALDDLPGTSARMRALKTLGVFLSMDDFGTRYSSLSSLKQLPLDQIKLGRSFVQDVASDGNIALLVQSIIDMSGKYRISVIAEGVENNAQLASLRERDCVAYQGFLFSEALPIEEFEKLLER